MMRHAKIQLSPAEQYLITNAEVLLTKNRVMRKIKDLLENVQEQMQQQSPTFSKPHILRVHPKISRGENYQGLPYLVLDYPRLFQQHAVFAIRSFFWWGHFFSSTLHLSGHYKESVLPKLEGAFETFSKHHIGINTDPWQYHFDATNYQPIAAISQEAYNTLLTHTACKNCNTATRRKMGTGCRFFYG